MLLIARLLFGSILRAFRSRSSLLLENLVLRQQLAVLKRKHPRPQIAVVDKLFWVLTRRVWSGWKQALTVVTPDTVVRWHREGFALYWRAISKARGVMGRKRISKEARDPCGRTRMRRFKHELPHSFYHARLTRRIDDVFEPLILGLDHVYREPVRSDGIRAWHGVEHPLWNA